MALFEYWNQFKAMAFSDELLIGIGAVLLLFGIYRIVKSSLTMMFWLILSAIGLGAISQGMDMSPFQLASANSNQLGDYLDQSKEMSSDVLNVLCKKLEEGEAGL